MNIEEAIFSRRSAREFTAQTVDDRDVDQLIEAAVYAPNAMHQQPWAFIVLRDKKLLKEISRDAKAHMLTNMTPSAQSEQIGAHLSDPNFDIFYGAPVLIVVAAVAHGPWIVEDCALAAENMMLFACAKKLGTCWVGFAQSFLNTADAKKLLGIPEEWVAVAPIIVGHPTSIPIDVPRKTPTVLRVG